MANKEMRRSKYKYVENIALNCKTNPLEIC